MNHPFLEGFLLEFRLPFADVFIDRNAGVLMVRYQESTAIDLSMGQHLVDSIYPFLKQGIDLGMTDATANYLSISKEARRFYSNNKSIALTKAHAIIVKSLSVRLLANFFVNFDNPIVPTKVFNEFSDANKWLLKSRSFKQNVRI